MKALLIYFLMILPIGAGASSSRSCKQLFSATKILIRELKKLVPAHLNIVVETTEQMEGLGVDLSPSVYESIEPGLYSFVVPAEGPMKGRFIIGKAPKHGHKTLGYSKVLAAGEISFEKENRQTYIDFINNKSGTFIMSPAILRPILEALVNSGIPLNPFAYRNFLGMPLVEIRRTSLLANELYFKHLKVYSSLYKAP